MVIIFNLLKTVGTPASSRKVYQFYGCSCVLCFVAVVQGPRHSIARSPTMRRLHFLVISDHLSVPFSHSTCDGRPIFSQPLVTGIELPHISCGGSQSPFCEPAQPDGDVPHRAGCHVVQIFRERCLGHDAKNGAPCERPRRIRRRSLTKFSTHLVVRRISKSMPRVQGVLSRS